MVSGNSFYSKQIIHIETVLVEEFIPELNPLLFMPSGTLGTD